MRKFILLTLAVGFLAPISSGNLYASVVGHWGFEEGPVGSAASGVNSLLDSSGNNLHMTPLTGPVYQAVSSPGSGLGLDFDGRDDLASVADSSLFQLTSLTLEAVIRFDGGDSLRQIFFRGDSRGGEDPYYLAVLNGKLRFYISDATANGIPDLAVHSPDLLPVGELMHVAATLDDSTDLMKIFINGSEVASQSAGGVRPNVALQANARVSIGALYDGFGKGQYFNGLIDEVRLSDVALSPDQFQIAQTVPEPSSAIVFLGMGSLMLLGSCWRRRRRR